MAKVLAYISLIRGDALSALTAYSREMHTLSRSMLLACDGHACWERHRG